MHDEAEKIEMELVRADLQNTIDGWREVCGYVVTVEERPLLPLAMGHTESVVSIRKARELAPREEPPIDYDKMASDAMARIEARINECCEHESTMIRTEFMWLKDESSKRHVNHVLNHRRRRYDHLSPLHQQEEFLKEAMAQAVKNLASSFGKFGSPHSSLYHTGGVIKNVPEGRVGER